MPTSVLPPIGVRTQKFKGIVSIATVIVYSAPYTTHLQWVQDGCDAVVESGG
jgi:hypothetical protein